jgi:hypothetical protein
MSRIYLNAFDMACVGHQSVLGIRPTTFAEFAHRSAEIFRGVTGPSHLWASGWQTASRAN